MAPESERACSATIFVSPTENVSRAWKIDVGRRRRGNPGDVSCRLINGAQWAVDVRLDGAEDSCSLIFPLNMYTVDCLYGKVYLH